MRNKFLTTFVLLIACVVATVRPTPSAAAAPTYDEIETTSSSIAATSLPGVRFVHTAITSGMNANTSGHVTYLNHPLLNGNPHAIFLVTQNLNPGGVGGTYNNHPIGVWYTGSTHPTFPNRWAIFNQNIAAMPNNAGFNVLIPQPGANVFVHTATGGVSGNIGCSFNHCTYLDHPLLNGNPNAIVLVTQNFTPHNVYNANEIGVGYDSVRGRWAIFNQFQPPASAPPMPNNASFNVVVANPPSTAFIHTATSGAGGNISGHVTYLNHPLLNGNPNAIFLVTQNWNPGGVGGTYNNQAIGVWYTGSTHPTFPNRWAIFNQNIAAMPNNAGFNVLIPDTRADVFGHRAIHDNILGNYTTIDHPLLNGNPNAIFLVTQNWNPDGVGSTHNNQAIGVWYTGSTHPTFPNRWAIFNQNIAAMPNNAGFNVLIPPPGANVFVHTARSGSGGNIVGHVTYIKHPLLNGNPHAIFLVTQNWNPGDVGGTYNNHPIGVWYDSGQEGGLWAIFNQFQPPASAPPMPNNASFNVMVLNNLTALPWSKAAFVHSATSGNTASNWTALDHPLSNSRPPAFVFATHNYNPGGTGGVYHNKHTGVLYTHASSAIQNRWAIFNQDATPIPDNAGFNVLVIVRQIFLPLIVK